VHKVFKGFPSCSIFLLLKRLLQHLLEQLAPFCSGKVLRGEGDDGAGVLEALAGFGQAGGLGGQNEQFGIVFEQGEFFLFEGQTHAAAGQFVLQALLGQGAFLFEEFFLEGGFLQFQGVFHGGDFFVGLIFRPGRRDPRLVVELLGLFEQAGFFLLAQGFGNFRIGGIERMHGQRNHFQPEAFFEISRLGFEKIGQAFGTRV